MARGRKTVHVWTDLRQHVFGGPAGNARDCVQSLNGRHERGESLGPFERLRQSVGCGRSFARYGRAIASQLTQLTLWPIWDETGLEQAVAQQIGDPFGIMDVRLATRHGFDVLRVGEEHLKLALEQV